MIKRHEDALMQCLEEIADNGFAQIEWVKLYRWYGMQRLGKSVWRDLRDRFTEIVAGGDEQHLWYQETGIGLVLVSSRRLKLLSEKIEE